MPFFTGGVAPERDIGSLTGAAGVVVVVFMVVVFVISMVVVVCLGAGATGFGVVAGLGAEFFAMTHLVKNARLPRAVVGTAQTDERS